MASRLPARALELPPGALPRQLQLQDGPVCLSQFEVDGVHEVLEHLGVEALKQGLEGLGSVPVEHALAVEVSLEGHELLVEVGDVNEDRAVLRDPPVQPVVRESPSEVQGGGIERFPRLGPTAARPNSAQGLHARQCQGLKGQGPS